MNSKSRKAVVAILTTSAVGLLVYVSVLSFTHTESQSPLPSAVSAQLGGAGSLTNGATTTDKSLSKTVSTTAPSNPPEYFEVIDSCGPYFESACLRVHSAPSEDAPVIWRLRKGMVFKIYGSITDNKHTWYKIDFDEQLLYPERVAGDLYVASDFVRPFNDQGVQNLLTNTVATSTKRIVIDRSNQTLYAYEGDAVFMEVKISTGLEPNLTEKGTFSIFKKTPTRYMQGPLHGTADGFYDLPGVPWDMYFTADGAAIHGAYWHSLFGTPQSHGCVNVPPEKAEELYYWTDLGTPVIVQ